MRARPVTATLIASVLTGLGGQLAVVASGVVAARALGPEDRGYLALLLLIPTAIAQLGSLGLPLAVTYHFSKSETVGRAALSRLVRPAIGSVTGMVLGHAVILLVLFGSDDFRVRLAGAISLLLIPTETAQAYGLAVLQGRREFTGFNALRLLPAVGYSALVVACFALGGDGLVLFTALFVGSYAVVSAVTLTTALRRSPPRPASDAPPLRQMIGFGLRGFLGAVSPIETLRLDQAVVGLLFSPSALGLYAVGVSFSNLPRFFAQSIGMVAYPHISAQAHEAAARRSMWRFLLLAVVVGLCVAVPLELAAGWAVPAIFGEPFRSAVDITRILLIAAVLLGARRVLTDASRGLAAPGLGSAAEVVSWIVLVPSVVFLAPSVGALGIALAFTASAAAGLLVLLALLGSASATRADGYSIGRVNR